MSRPCDGATGVCPYEASGNMDCYNNCGVGASQHDDPADEFKDSFDFVHEHESIISSNDSEKIKIKLIVNIQDLLVEGVYINSDDYDIEVLVIESDDQADVEDEELESAAKQIEVFTNNELFQSAYVEKVLIEKEYDVEVKSND